MKERSPETRIRIRFVPSVALLVALLSACAPTLLLGEEHAVGDNATFSLTRYASSETASPPEYAERGFYLRGVNCDFIWTEITVQCEEDCRFALDPRLYREDGTSIGLNSGWETFVNGEEVDVDGRNGQFEVQLTAGETATALSGRGCGGGLNRVRIEIEAFHEDGYFLSAGSVQFMLRGDG